MLASWIVSTSSLAPANLMRFLARALWIPAVLTWDEATGEVREGLHHVV